MNQRIIIVDFGSRTARLLAQRVRQAQVFSHVLPGSIAADQVRAMNPAGVIITGGAWAQGEAALAAAPLFSLGVPVLGIGGGMLLMARTLGGEASSAEKSMDGQTDVSFSGACTLTAGMAPRASCLMDRSGHVTRLPAGFAAAAHTDDGLPAAMADEVRKLYAVQFYPELEQTERGTALIAAFLRDICGCTQQWTMAGYADSAVQEIRQTVGDGSVLLALSGGVDSAVTAALLHRAIGSRLHCVFVDHGFMRKGEPERVRQVFTSFFPVHLTMVDASDRFFAGMKGVSDPEQKRKFIGTEFISVFREEARKLGRMDHFAQGTIYPDVIESGAAPGSAVIKSHHNVGGLPKELGFTSLIEPLRMLFKDEVRQLGLVLGLPRDMVMRQPFPGPGLAIRVIGEVTREKTAIVREADAILREEIASAGLDSAISQYFTVLTNVRSVGVTGDQRTYSSAIALRAVITDDFMAADWARIPYDTLAHISTRIVNEVPGVNRVLYDVTAKPPASIEWE
jgi:GMP synthase (glutamine-hydrolysing)